MIISNTEITALLHPESNFISDIQKCVAANCDIFDCMSEWLHKRNIEIEQVLPIIRANQGFKQQLTKAAESLNFLKHKKRK